MVKPDMELRVGELAALMTAVCWTATSLAFEYAAKRIGSLALNIWRLVIALLIFGALGLLRRGELVPLSADAATWFWLTLSGLVGFVFGDLFLFQSYIDIGARSAQAVFASSPLMTALLGRLFLGEAIGALGFLGMALVVAGIALVIMDRGAAAPKASETGASAASSAASGAAATSPRPDHKLRGAAFALLGALGQAGGLILSKIGAPSGDPFAATQIRVIAGLVGFLALAALWKRLPEVAAAARPTRTFGVLSIGAFFGPFLGVSLGLFAVQRANAGIAATLMGLTPVLILVPAILFRRERVSLREAAGAAMAVAGSALLFL